MRRSLAMPVVAALPVACLVLAPMSDAGAQSPFGSTAATPFDAYIASGDASCLELTVNVSGYSFIVEPDARMPRATSSISEGASGALAAPADPGDSVDALAGLLIPREEGQIAGGIDGALAQTKIPFPLDVGNTLLSVSNPINPHLEYPIEHANVAYPDPQSPGDQEATFLGAPNASFSDPSGVIRADGTTGDAKAGAAYAAAEAGAGAAASLPLLGVSAGRIASQARSQVSASAVTNDVSCTLHDVGIAPPGSGHSLHIGTLAATLHTERSLTGKRATSRPTLHLADVTLDGKNLIPAGGGDVVLPPGVPGTITFPQPSPCPSPLPCSSLPSPPASLRSISVAGTTHSETLGASNNEDSSVMTAASVTMQTTAPVPSSIPPSGGGNPITAAPTTYTLQIANLDSSTYGLPSTSPLLTNPPFGSGSTGLGAFGGFSQNFGTGTAGSAGTRPVASTITIPGIAAAIRWPVVALAGLLESLLLASLLLRRRRMTRALQDASPSTFLDLP